MADIIFTNTELRVFTGNYLMAVTFTLVVDAIAQEFNETFSIHLSDIPLSNITLFPTPPIAVYDTLNVTIIDRDGEPR